MIVMNGTKAFKSGIKGELSFSQNSCENMTVKEEYVFVRSEVFHLAVFSNFYYFSMSEMY